MKYAIIPITLLLLLGGCDQPEVESKDTNSAPVAKQTYLPPPPPKKEIKLKDVNDTNFDADYMYPKASKEKVKVATAVEASEVPTDTMDKTECIAMITQEKFDKYAAMFGSEAASIKRCKMIKAAR
ncbi:MAG: hypothetical protein WBM70_05000 [Sulfurovum sp.]|jgi:hypothetical protein|uniref:hypothetical protein n=1 Tax=Sulfurovum sp. TaxID=1969726 RepID=UPI003C7875EA